MVPCERLHPLHNRLTFFKGTHHGVGGPTHIIQEKWGQVDPEDCCPRPDSGRGR